MIVRGIIPHEAIVAEVRAEVERRLAQIPAPTVLNVEAVLAIGAGREFAWQGRRYRAPPLPFPVAFRLLVCAHALREALMDAAPCETHLRVARQLLDQLTRPVASFPRLRRSRWARGTPDELLSLFWWLLDVPDAAPRLVPDTPQTIDWLDQLGQFALAYPQAVDAFGQPRYWETYVRGLRHLHRTWARKDLRLAWASRAAQADTKEFKAWNDDLKRAASW